MANSADIDQLQAQITRLKQENEKLRASNRRWMRIAGTDDLTGVPNKVFFSTALLPQVITQHNAEGRSFAGVMVAPDNLGDINKKYGREGGDRIVVGLAEYLKENIEPGEKLIPIDGANFVIIVANGDAAEERGAGFSGRQRPVGERPVGDPGLVHGPFGMIVDDRVQRAVAFGDPRRDRSHNGFA